MKKCKNCGMIQSNDNTVCLDCNSPLVSFLSEDENKQAEVTLKKQVDNLADKTDEFYVSLRDRILGYSQACHSWPRIPSADIRLGYVRQIPVEWIGS